MLRQIDVYFLLSAQIHHKTKIMYAVEKLSSGLTESRKSRTNYLWTWAELIWRKTRKSWKNPKLLEKTLEILDKTIAKSQEFALYNSCLINILSTSRFDPRL